MTRVAFVSAATLNIFSSARPPETSLMIVAPSKPISNITSKGRSRRVYTINKSNRIFSVKINNEEYESTTLLSFSRKIDAVKIAGMLENHYNLTKEWPETLLNPNSGIFLMGNEIVDDIDLNYVSINNWNFNEFNNLCVNNLIDYLYIHNINKILE
jgi:hypothetical protein